MRSLADRGSLRVVSAGDFSSYDAMPDYRLAVGPLPSAEDLRDDARREHARVILDAYRHWDGHGAAAQLSRPNPLDTALLTLVGKPDFRRPVRLVRDTADALRVLPRLHEAARRDIREAVELSADTEVPVVWQLETPAVLYALNLVPGPVRRAVARVLARQVAAALADIPPGTAVLHLCYGNLADTELVAPRDTKPAVLFLNALGNRLTSLGLPLPPVHVPFAFGSNPPPTSANFYASLGNLRHPWRLIAGVADENDPRASRLALELIESRLGRPAHGVATACGLGRHSEADTEKALALLATLAEM
ncbi:hypothetical protein HUO13_01435 [Saccharopolyspora erythraea]|uniref:hypothetical protein n=1 Tax=Saccharopolyspora erythraea TaxID=1836 RepID=UPI001BAAD7FA|nr:hypothetical protein [Saccharopolyspora erythraea]QUG99633.1 hypothetical protein HUO13_01435 [Saccharopolyspora erythraea]